MILSNKHDIEQGTTYSFMLNTRENISLIDLVNITNSMLSPFNEIKVDESLPLELTMLQDISLNLNDRLSKINSIADKLNEESLMNCEEITIVDYGCGQGLASLCLLDWFLKNSNIKNIKQVKLIDKDKCSLKRALLHYSLLFPEVEVVAYEQDFLKKDLAVECNSVLTINLFSHVVSSEFEIIKNILNLILDGHNLLMHNIFLDEVYSKKDSKCLRPYYFDFISHQIQDYIGGCKQILNYITTRLDGSEAPSHLSMVVSRTNILETSIPYVNYKYQNLCPGEPTKKLANVPLTYLWNEKPLENTDYCKNLDDKNKISLQENYISPSFTDTYTLKADRLNPKTIKKCAEQFYEGHISHALTCELKCGYDIVAIYEKAAKDGITEAYNNLGILKLQNTLEDKKAKQQAIEYFKMAATGGSVSAMMNLASVFMEQGDFDTAIQYYNSAARKGNGNALFNLAVIANFGLYGQKIDMKQAEELYLQCINEFNKDENLDWRGKAVQSSSCLNLLYMLYYRGVHYLKLLDIYYQVKKPSEDLNYFKEILQIIYTNRFSNNVKETLLLNKNHETEKPYQKFNRAIFIYYGLNLESVEIERDRNKAFNILKSLAKDESIHWDIKNRIVHNLLASWCEEEKEKEDYLRKAAEFNKDYECAFLTNMALNPNIEIAEEEKKSIIKHFSNGDGCIHCHDCRNYNDNERKCPKAQMIWAEEIYDQDKQFAMKLINKSAEQGYYKALFHLGYKKAIEDNIPSFINNDELLKNYREVLPYKLPDEYKVLLPIMAKDCYYLYLQKSALIENYFSRKFIPYVAQLRADKYEFIFWSLASYNIVFLKHVMDFLASKCGRSLSNYFDSKTICEKQMIKVAERIALLTKDITFRSNLAKFYLQSNSISALYKADKYCSLAKKLGSKEFDHIIEKIKSDIARYESKQKTIRFK